MAFILSGDIIYYFVRYRGRRSPHLSLLCLHIALGIISPSGFAALVDSSPSAKLTTDDSSQPASTDKEAFVSRETGKKSA